MASVVILTRGRHDRERQGRPASARYTPDRKHELASALFRRGHEVTMWWDLPLGPCLLEAPEFVYVRSGSEVNLQRAEAFDPGRTKVMNKPSAHRLAGDKLRASQALLAVGISTPQTELDPALLPDNFSMVVGKPQRGSSGQDTVLIPRDQALLTAGLVFQPFLDIEAHLRATVVDGKLLAAERRWPAHGDFRANLAAGARTEPLSFLDPEAEALAIRSVQVLGLDIGGVDLVETSDGLAVLEVNPATTLWHPVADLEISIAEAVADLAC